MAGPFFWHRFFSHQPDLSFGHPAVRAAVFEVMGFWLRQWVDGFRLDAIPCLVERDGTSNENLREYFGDDDEWHMACHFPLMPRMHLAIAQEDRRPVVAILQPGNRKVLACVREVGTQAVLRVADLSRHPQPLGPDLAGFRGRVPVEMSGRMALSPIGEMPSLLASPGLGFSCLRLSADAAPPEWLSQRLPADDLPVLVLFDGWNSLFRDSVAPWRVALASRTLQELEGSLLPRCLARQPWWAAAARAAAAGPHASGQPPLEPVAPVPASPHLRLQDHPRLQQACREWLLA